MDALLVLVPSCHYHRQHQLPHLHTHNKNNHGYRNQEGSVNAGGIDGEVGGRGAAMVVVDSKASILKKTKEYILELRRTVEEWEGECRRLREEVRRIRSESGRGNINTAAGLRCDIGNDYIYDTSNEKGGNNCEYNTIGEVGGCGGKSGFIS
jgi:hypothetical protein